MHPNFVIIKATNEHTGVRTLEICGKSYVDHRSDSFISDAITLATRWQEHQITHDRIVHLRNWIRENDHHGHHIPFKHIKDLLGCKYFIDSVIEAEFPALVRTIRKTSTPVSEKMKGSFSNSLFIGIM